MASSPRYFRLTKRDSRLSRDNLISKHSVLYLPPNLVTLYIVLQNLTPSFTLPECKIENNVNIIRKLNFRNVNL